jgi:DNA gyrase subunit A
MGRSARGVKGMTLDKTDIVVGMEVIEKDCKDTLLLVTESGYGKRSEIPEYRVQSRGGVGTITQKTTDKVGNVIGTKKVRTDQEVILSTDKGQNIRMKVSDISILGRNTQGVRLINLKDSDEKVTGMAIVDKDEEDTQGSGEAPQVH